MAPREPLKIIVDVRPPKWAGKSLKEGVEFLQDLVRLDQQRQYVILANEPAPFAFTTQSWNFSLDVVGFRPGLLLDALALPFFLKIHRANILHSFNLSIPHFTRCPIILSLPEDEKVISNLKPGALSRAKKILVRDETMKKEMVRHQGAQEERIIITPSAEVLVQVYQEVAAEFSRL